MAISFRKLNMCQALRLVAGGLEAPARGLEAPARGLEAHLWTEENVLMG